MALLVELQGRYAGRGVNLVRRGDKWAFRTAADLNFLLRREQTDNKPLSRAALETLAIIAYHQPATRAEVEEVRGVATGKGTLDLLMEAGWVRMRGRRRTPGRPVTYGTTEAFLDHFGLEVACRPAGARGTEGRRAALATGCRRACRCRCRSTGRCARTRTRWTPMTSMGRTRPSDESAD